jgi:uncharacterized protein YndB with AHSA1/START domain
MPAKPSVTSATGTVASPSLTIKRHLKAPPEKVYAAWTNPQNIVRWFGPPGVSAGSERATIDARTGGSYRLSFDKDDEHYEVGGVYREVVPYERLVFTWAWHSTPERESLVTVSLKREGEGTLLTLQHEQFVDQTARDNHERGWTDLFGNLEKLLA